MSIDYGRVAQNLSELSHETRRSRDDFGNDLLRHRIEDPRVRRHGLANHLASLATAKTIAAQRLRAALAPPFSLRKSHALPVTLPAPHAAWADPCAAMAGEWWACSQQTAKTWDGLLQTLSTTGPRRAPASA
jgi:hypothetical protein